MTEPLPLHVVDPADPPKAEPRVFVRTIATPPGLPWDQSGAAALEAKLGAPLPLAGVAYQVRRLDPWQPGRPARFAAFYVRADEIGENFSTVMEVAGRSLQIRFTSMAVQLRRARNMSVLAAVVGGSALIVALAVVLALHVRSQTDLRLTALEARASSQFRQAKAIAGLREQTVALDAVGARERNLDRVLNDLMVISAAKNPSAHIQAFHWDRGFSLLEVRGDAPPFAAFDRPAQKLKVPLRPGVWLWSVAPATTQPQQP